MKTILAFVALLAGSWLVGAWLLMLSVGIVHAEWIPQLPTIGYPLALILSGLVVARAIIGATFGQLGKLIGGDDR